MKIVITKNCFFPIYFFFFGGGESCTNKPLQVYLRKNKMGDRINGYRASSYGPLPLAETYVYHSMWGRRQSAYSSSFLNSRNIVQSSLPKGEKWNRWAYLRMFPSAGSLSIRSHSFEYLELLIFHISVVIFFSFFLLGVTLKWYKWMMVVLQSIYYPSIFSFSCGKPCQYS